jgi:hypothetical protein
MRPKVPNLVSKKKHTLLRKLKTHIKYFIERYLDNRFLDCQILGFPKKLKLRLRLRLILRLRRYRTYVIKLSAFGI